MGEPVSFAVSPFDVFSLGATSWTFGDGGQAGGNAVSHTYTVPGQYPVTVSTVDGSGNVSTQTGMITISDLPKPPPPPPPPPPSPSCIVPKLVGKKLGAAKKAIKAAGCKVGMVTKLRARKGKKRSPLVVRSSKPSAGAILEVGGKVDLRLGRKPR